ncbi:MAG: acyl-CoA thioester hydrolase/BAAT C-terminal domain-containing protein [Bacteroidia bacterium]
MKKFRPLIIIAGLIAALVGGYFMLNSMLFDGISPQHIETDGFQANIFSPKKSNSKAAVVILGGGQFGDYWGQSLAKKGYTGLSLPYHRKPGLPDLPEEIPLEYFQKAIAWLTKQTAVDADKIVVMGASRNAELALLVASTFPDAVAGAIAYAPGSASWSNTVLPFNSDELKPSWTFQGKPVPYIAMNKIQGGDSDRISLLDYWRNGLADSAQYSTGHIPVERIKGPILLLSGLDDQVWPAAEMSDLIEAKLKAYNFQHRVDNIQYEDAGHLISGNPDFLNPERDGQMTVNGRNYRYNFGGTSEGDQKAQQDARARVFEFMNQL